MAFCVFEPYHDDDGAHVMHPNGQERFRLAGDNLISQAWYEQGEPIDEGWHITEEYLIHLHTNGEHNLTNRRLIIDFAPRAMNRIGLLELRDIYAYKWGNHNPVPLWMPLMFRYLRVLDQAYDPPLNEAGRATILHQVPVPSPDADVYFAFLYLQPSFNFGPIGATNATFLYGAALTYFQQFLPQPDGFQPPC